MSKKIAIAGIHDSGKTTLLYKIRNYFIELDKDVYVIEESARKCPYPSCELGTPKSQRWIWEAHINEERKGRQSECDIVLCDRTLMDNLIYYKYLLNDKVDPIFEALTDYTLKWMDTYDYISVLDINWKYIAKDINDDFTISDKDKTIAINKLFIKYLKPFQNIDINRFNYKEVIMEILK